MDVRRRQAHADRVVRVFSLLAEQEDKMQDNEDLRSANHVHSAVARVFAGVLVLRILSRSPGCSSG